MVFRRCDCLEQTCILSPECCAIDSRTVINVEAIEIAAWRGNLAVPEGVIAEPNGIIIDCQVACDDGIVV